MTDETIETEAPERDDYSLDGQLFRDCDAAVEEGDAAALRALHSIERAGP